MVAPRTLLFGKRGQDVKELQEALNRLLKPSPNLKPDGQFGQRTKTAVVSLQRDMNRYQRSGLTEDGIVGPNTRAALETYDKAVRLGEHFAQPGTAELIRYAGGRVPFYCQGDARWNSRSLKSKTIGAKGCTLTCIAMILKYYKHDVDPATVDEHLDSVDGYIGNNLKWQDAFDAGQTPGRHRLRLSNHDFRDVGQFTNIFEERCKRNWPTLVNVDYGESGDGVGDHWVVVVGRTSGGCTIINDPAFMGGDGTRNGNREITLLERSTRRGGLHPVRLCLFTVS